MTTATPARRGPRRQKRIFLREFLAHPTTVGAIAPSGPHLAERMADAIPFGEVGAIAEFGPGTGALTGAVLGRLRPETRFFGIEINPEMVKLLRRRYPDVKVFEDSVANVRAICDREGIDHLDAIISGLPWVSFSDELQVQLLTAAADILRPGGTFVTFGYHGGQWTPKGRKFHAMLPRYFSRVDRRRMVWRNVPPAFVVRCVK